MHVLLTGATGTLGQALVQRLLAEGNRVSCLTRRPYRCQALLGGRVAWCEWHPLSEPLPGQSLEGVEAIIHLAGEPLVPMRAAGNAERYAASRLVMAQRIAEATRGRGIRLVGVSAALAPAGDGAPVSDRAELVTDCTPGCTPGCNPGRTPDRTPGLDLVRGFEAELLAAGDGGASVAVVRLGLVAAPGGPLEGLVRLAKSGFIPRLRGVKIAAIALDDAIAMLSGLAGERSLTGIVHGVAPEPIAGEHLAGMLGAVAPLGFALPIGKRRLARRLGVVISAMLGSSRRMLPDKLLAAGAEFSAADPTRSVAKAIAEIVAGNEAEAEASDVLSGAEKPSEATSG